MVTARQRRRAVEHLKSRNVSERRACKVVGFSRSAAWRPLQGRDDATLRSELKELAERYEELADRAVESKVRRWCLHQLMWNSYVYFWAYTNPSLQL